MKSAIAAVALALVPGLYALSSVQHGANYQASLNDAGVKFMDKDEVDEMDWPPRGSPEDLVQRAGKPILQKGASDDSMDWPPRGSPEDLLQRTGQPITQKDASDDSVDWPPRGSSKGSTRHQKQQLSPGDGSGDSMDWPERGSPEDLAKRHPHSSDQDHDGTSTFEPDWNNPHLNILESLQEHASRFIRLFTGPVDVTGHHEFVPPNFEAGDQRGPCPGLNALANHNYIPRSGVVNAFQVILAINRVYGVSLDLGALLAGLSTVWAGIPISINPRFSINGSTPLVEYPLHGFLGALGQPQGISGGHNLLESDGSNTRGDIYETGHVGDNFRLRLPRFMEWYNMSPGPVGDYNLWLMSERGAKAFEDSKRNNPFFWRGPISGLIIANGVLTLPPALMANHSGLNPIGHLTKDIIKSFYGIYGEEPNFEYREGWERIPNNWYRRRTDYTLAHFLLGGQAVAARHPTLFSMGGNTGKVNTFTGIDLSDIFGGAFHSVNLLKGNTTICLGLELLKTITPSPFSSLYSNFVVPLKIIEEAINPIFKVMNCPVVDDLARGGTPVWDAIKGRFPGAKMGPFPY